MLNKTALILFALLVNACSVFDQISQSCGLENVAGFDIGSGTTKMLIAEVDTCNHEIDHILAQATRPVSYSQDLAKQSEPLFSKQIMAEGTRAIDELNLLAENYSVTSKKAVATHAFRQAHNARELLDYWQDQFGIQIEIISQEQEGILAHKLIAHQKKIEDARTLLAWDMGGGSQQLVWKTDHDSYHFFNSQIASVSFKNKALETLNRPENTSSPNPISSAEAQQLDTVAKDWIGPLIPSEFYDFIQTRPTIVALGGVHGASLKNQMNLREGEYIKKNHLKQTISKQLDKSDQEIGGQYAETDVTNLILVHALMDIYGINEYQFMSADLTKAVILFQ